MNKVSTAGTYRTENVDRQARLQGVRLASFRSRAAAFLIDLTIVVVALLTPGALVLLLQGPPGPTSDIKVESGSIISFAVFVAYFALTTYWGRGRTPGKRLLGIQVISIVHPRLSLWHCIERALGYAASSLEAGFGFLQYFTHPNRQTVHDRIAETIVVKQQRPG